jgi:hypothetical protein
MISSRWQRPSLCALILAASAAAARPTLAQPTGFPIGDNCGLVVAGWNAPRGALVLNHSTTGPVPAVMSAIGEFRTHSMLSHGPGGSVTHATMTTPDQNGWPLVCGLPLVAGQLEQGYPGLETVNQGAIYGALYGPNGGTTYLEYLVGPTANQEAIAAAVEALPIDVDAGGIIHPLRNAARAPYSLSQYRDLQDVNQPGGSSNNNGVVCSTFLAWAHAQAGQGVVPPFTYPHSKVNAVAYSLHASVYSDCASGLGFWGSVGISLVCPFFDVCDNAANQVTNCMGTGMCSASDSTLWTAVANDPGAVARSISPDRLGGWSGHPISSSIWAASPGYQVQWNAPGAVFGCWK